MNNIDKQYQDLLKDILENGVEKSDRTGTGTLSVFGRQIRHKMSDGYPLLTTKKMAFKTMVTELLWFLKGDTNIRYLVDNNCHIWDGDAYKRYVSKVDVESIAKSFGTEVRHHTMEEFIERIKTDNEFAKKWGSLGKIYGHGWRNWNGKSDDELYEEFGNKSIDQISDLIKQLKENPDSRRLLVSAWNASDLPNQVLPPCHYGFQVYTRELRLTERLRFIEQLNLLEMFEEELSISLETNPQHDVKNFRRDFCDKHNIPTRAISLMYNARSQDVPLGTPFNISSYALLLEIIAKMVNMIPDELISNMGDCHIYKDQIDGVKEQLTREPYPLPKLVISDDVNFNGTIDDFLNSCSISDLKIEGYQSHPPIKIPLSN
jgi:thymidylate synthase